MDDFKLAILILTILISFNGLINGKRQNDPIDIDFQLMTDYSDDSFIFDGKDDQQPFHLPSQSGQPSQNLSHCFKQLYKYSNAYSQFILCSLQSGTMLFSMCRNCAIYYSRLIQSHHQIIRDNVTISRQFGILDGLKCSEDLMYSFHVQVVKQSHQHALNLWKSCSCDDCFYQRHQQNDDWHLHPNVTHFFTVLIDTRNCFLNFFNKSGSSNNNITMDDNELMLDTKKGNASICTQCRDAYNHLTKTYSLLTPRVSQCGDIVYMINITRTKWINAWKCDTEADNKTWLIIISTLAFLSPVVFYSYTTMAGRAKRREERPLATCASNQPVGRNGQLI